MAITLRDIARHVNLSHATVSFVLNDRRDVAIPETTRLRVMEAAKELGYHPNRAARALVMGRTRVIGVWTPPLESSYLQKTFQGLTDKFRQSGFDSLYCTHSPEFLSRPFEWPVDGIVFVEGSEDRQAEPFPDGVPLVMVGSNLSSGVDQVNIDLTTGTTEAVMHLLESGRSHIVCISGERDQGEGTVAHTYQKIINSAGHPARCFSTPDGTCFELLHKVTEFLKTVDKVDGVLCSSDKLTLVTRRALANLGRTVPTDAALVGFDYSELSEVQTPSLSAIEIPVAEVVVLASEMLLARLSNPQLEYRRETVKTSLRVLQSSSESAPISFENRTTLR